MPSDLDDRVVIRCPLPAPIGVAPETLGSAVVTVLVGRAATVHLPRLTGDELILVQPLVLDPLVEEPGYSDGRDPESNEPTSPWGWPTDSDSSGNVASFAIAQIVMTLDSVSPGNADEVYWRSIRGFPTWFNHLKDWVEVLNHQDLDYVAPRRRVQVEDQGWVAWRGGNQLGVYLDGRIFFDFDYGEPLTFEQWTRLMELAGAGREAATEYLLLRDAKAAHVRGNYRQSVVDAATALEMALYRLLSIENQSAPSALGDELVAMAERWTLGTLLRTLRRLRPLPASITDDLVQLRNTVVHKTARQPTEAESAAIRAAASDAVGVAVPRDEIL